MFYVKAHTIDRTYKKYFEHSQIIEKIR